jgi:pimeloyl-ACP methyl ester carboxylesterase
MSMRRCGLFSGADFPIHPPRCSSKTVRDFSAIAAPSGRCRIGSAKPTCLVSARLTGNPASGAGSIGTAPWQRARIHQPSLFIAGSNDAVVTGLIGAKHVADMERVLPNLKQKLIIDGAGHWIQQERANEVNAALIAFLKENADQAKAFAQ